MSGDSKTSTASRPSSSVIFVSTLSGAAIAAMAIHFATRGQARSSVTTEQLRHLEQSLRNSKQDIVKEVTQGLAQTTAHFKTSLLSQEATIQKSLQPVAAAQQQLSHINRDVSAIKNIFNAPKTRGSFGEFQLETLIQNSMPLGQYEFQYTLTNNKRVDCILHLPSPMGKLAIDSKFPMEIFLRSDDNKEDARANDARKKTQELLTKHINDIASKYIIPGETADYAVLFLPSETLFLQIVEHYSDMILFANEKRVYLACPTTLMALLTQLHGAMRGMAVHQQTEDMSKLIQKLMDDVDRLVERFDGAEKQLNKSKEKLDEMKTSIEKIRNGRDKLVATGLFPTARSAKHNKRSASTELTVGSNDTSTSAQ